MVNLKISYRNLKRDIIKILEDDDMSYGEQRDSIEEIIDEYVEDFFPDEIPYIEEHGYCPDYKTYWKNFGGRKAEQEKIKLDKKKAKVSPSQKTVKEYREIMGMTQ